MAEVDAEGQFVESWFGGEAVEPEAAPEPEPEAEPSFTADEWVSMAEEPDWTAEDPTPEIDPFSPGFESQVADMTDEKLALALQDYAGVPEVEQWWQDRQARKQAAQEQEGQRVWDENEALINDTIDQNRTYYDVGKDTDVRAFLPDALMATYAALQDEGYSPEQAAEILQNADKQTLVELTTGAASEIARDNAIKDYWIRRV